MAFHTVNDRSELAGQRVPPTERHKAADIRTLHDHLQMAETAAFALAFNFMGDGCFEDPARAPGVAGMVSLVADSLAQAENAAAALGEEYPTLKQACGLAAHLAAQSNEELNSGVRGFRIGDQQIGMCYWTIEQLAIKAYKASAHL